MYHNPKPKVCSQKPLFLLVMETSCAQTMVGIFPVFLESAGVRAGTLPSLLQQRGASITQGTAFCPWLHTVSLWGHFLVQLIPAI